MKEKKEAETKAVTVVMPPALCTWVSTPTGILDCFKVLNCKTHHSTKDTQSHIKRAGEKRTSLNKAVSEKEHGESG